MIENQKYSIALISENDLDRVMEIYNSNEYFLVNHTGVKSISKQWLEKEYQEMKKINFATCKIIDKSTKRIVAICDFKIQEIVYLSLLMVDNALKSQGMGKEIYTLLEEYFIKQKAQQVRIDVVYDYPNNVLEFWEKLHFINQEEIELEWNGVKLKAYLMTKLLASKNKKNT